MPLNAEGLPIEGIDRIQVRLNHKLVYMTDLSKITEATEYGSKIYRSKRNELRLEHFFYYGIWSILSIQGQLIDHNNDIRLSIAKAIFQLIQEEIIKLPKDLPLVFIYNNLQYLVAEIKEIEFYFDFRRKAINILYPERLINKNGAFYSSDWRPHEDRPTRKSFLAYYDRPERLKKLRKIPWKIIDANPYKKRIEFRLTKENCKLRTLNDIAGTYLEVINRYMPYLAIIYFREFFGNVIVDCDEHPIFYYTYELAAEGKKRYHGKELEKRTTPKESTDENDFYHKLLFLRWLDNAKNNRNSNSKVIVELALNS
jgi:hypothetical protein